MESKGNSASHLCVLVYSRGHACPDQPYQATLTLSSLNGVVIAQVKSDAQGHFRVPLVPGEYILHPEALDGVAFAGDQSFVVETGRYIQLSVNYDSSLR